MHDDALQPCITKKLPDGCCIYMSKVRTWDILVLAAGWSVLQLVAMLALAKAAAHVRMVNLHNQMPAPGSSCMQKQQAASEARDELQQWVQLVQQLTNEPVQSLDEGQAAVASVLETVQGLEDQQRHAFEDLASKEEAASTAEARVGTLECHIAASGCVYLGLASDSYSCCLDIDH